MRKTARIAQRVVIYIAVPALVAVAAGMAIGYGIIAIVEDSAADF